MPIEFDFPADSKSLEIQHVVDLPSGMEHLQAFYPKMYLKYHSKTPFLHISLYIRLFHYFFKLILAQWREAY